MLVYFLKEKRWSDARQLIDSLPEGEDKTNCLHSLMTSENTANLEKDRSKNILENGVLLPMKTFLRMETFSKKDLSKKEAVSEFIEDFMRQCLQDNRWQNGLKAAELLDELDRLSEE